MALSWRKMVSLSRTRASWIVSAAMALTAVSFIACAPASAGSGYLASIAATAAASQASGGPAPTTPPVPPAPEHAADFKITLYGGEEIFGKSEVGLTDVLSQGRPVVLNFWAGACPPCRKEMPDLQEVYERHQDRLLLLGVDGGPFLGLGTSGEGRGLVREMGITYPTGTTSDSRIMRDYGVFGMPTTYFIKPDGEVIARKLGILTREKLTALVEELIERSEGRSQSLEHREVPHVKRGKFELQLERGCGDDQISDCEPRIGTP